jgi:hypothetical protein
VDEESANRLARQRNDELGRQGVRDRFHTAVERAPGEWKVDLRHAEPERRSLRARILDVILDILAGG